MIEKRKDRIVKRLNISISEETYETLQRLKAKTGKTMGQLIEEAVKLLEAEE
ncbi:Transcriptional regulator, RHH [Saccharolobus shibatae B12]|uniref:Uncharacterized protein E-51 n=2 Tax=root TaxID=1 RepID=E51_SSV1|nr:ribbon-helix-helix protein, CopG family [Saccharolobus shibatae]NP_039784.1 ribbon-helix-helix protein, CopG family [Sulfolobus spindle-shaped virus 1]P20217.1 RecName: Full=Uncharacterized protein E-51 [Sulfolobus spindle-shaped virus 1]QXJ30277.1 Transcriptional regulator, RHH [Saccharolobus shibatae B12]CAA30217.1 ORF E-51 [Sulfolobus spindle-shaped virus 1]